MAEARRERRARRGGTSDVAGSLAETWRRLNFEQRVAAVAALLLIASTFGPFSFVEAAIVLTALGVLALVKQRADLKDFHLPFGDGTVIFAAGLWTGVLIFVRLFDRDLGQSILALVCAAVLAGAGARERAKRPADDLPRPKLPEPDAAVRDARRARRERGSEDPTRRLRAESVIGPTPEWEDPAGPPEPETTGGGDEDPTAHLDVRDAPTEEQPGARTPRREPSDVDDRPRREERP